MNLVQPKVSLNTEHMPKEEKYEATHGTLKRAKTHYQSKNQTISGKSDRLERLEPPSAT